MRLCDSPPPFPEEPTSEPSSGDTQAKDETPISITENKQGQESKSVENLPSQVDVETEQNTATAKSDTVPIIKRLTGKRPKLSSIRTRFIEVTE